MNTTQPVTPAPTQPVAYHGRPQIPTVEIDLRDTHPGQIPNAVLATFDDGRFVAGTVLMLPLRYRIAHTGQTRPELYSQAVEVAASAQAVRLSTNG